MRTKLRLYFLLAAVTAAALSACTSSTAPASGTGTLQVSAELEVAPGGKDVPASADDFTMHATVRVWRGNEEVRDAMVMLTSDRGAVRLHDEGEAIYTALQVGYASSYKLDVIAGTDYVTSAPIEGPTVHLFESPLPGATQPAGMPLMVRWSPAGGATAMIQTKMMDEVATDDTGEFMVPAAVMVAGNDVRDDEVRVVRVVSAPLAGTIGASQLEIRVSNDVGFEVVPN